MPDVSENKPYIRSKPIMEKDPEKMYSILGIAKSAFPTLKSKIKMQKRENKLYPIFIDRQGGRGKPVLYVKVSSKRYIVSRFFAVHVNGVFTHYQFEVEREAI
jgi:hypothetical protein